MITVSRDIFLKILKFRPQHLIGTQIIYDKIPQRIYDVSMCGDYIFIDKGTMGKEWFLADSVEDTVVIDTVNPMDIEDIKFFSLSTITKRIEMLENRVGQPDSKQSKPLFEIVTALNKELLELKLKINEMEAKEKNHERIENKRID